MSLGARGFGLKIYLQLYYGISNNVLLKYFFQDSMHLIQSRKHESKMARSKGCERNKKNPRHQLQMVHVSAESTTSPLGVKELQVCTQRFSELMLAHGKQSLLRFLLPALYNIQIDFAPVFQKNTNILKQFTASKCF